MDQYLLAGLDVSGLVQRAIRRLAGDGQARRLLEVQGAGLACQHRYRHHGIFGVAAALPRDADNRVANLPSAHPGTERVDDAGDIRARDLSDTAARGLPVHRIHARGAHLDQDFARARAGHGHLAHRQRATLTHLYALHFLGGGLYGRAQHHGGAHKRETHDHSSFMYRNRYSIDTGAQSTL